MTEIILLKRSSNDNVTTEIRKIPDPVPEDNQVVIKNNVIGISKLDLVTRDQLISGHFQNNEVVLGYEAAGHIVTVGKNVKGFKAGDKVVYFSPQAGCCATKCAVDMKYVIALPQDVSETVAASLFLKGMISHALAVRVFSITGRSRILVHEIDRPTGQILAQFIKSRHPAMLIGTTASEENVKKLEHGAICDKILCYNSENMIEDLMLYTKDQGVNVVYDGVGSSYIFHKSIGALANFGLLALYNASVFSVDKILPIDLAKKSLYITAMTVFQYKNLREEIVLTAEEVFDMLHRGLFTIGSVEYHASKINEALNSIHASKSTGSIVLTF